MSALHYRKGIIGWSGLISNTQTGQIFKQDPANPYLGKITALPSVGNSSPMPPHSATGILLTIAQGFAIIQRRYSSTTKISMTWPSPRGEGYRCPKQILDGHSPVSIFL